MKNKILFSILVSIVMALICSCARVGPLTLTVDDTKKTSGVVYVSDSRQEIEQIQNPQILENARANVALIDARYIRETSTLITLSGTPLTEKFNLCGDQKYATQLSVANCSGVLISPRHVLTAGHCLSEETCAQYKIVFDFRHDSQHYSPNSSSYRIPRENMYSCKNIIAQVTNPGWNQDDYTIVELDRPVSGRHLVKLEAREMQVSEGIYTLGYPLGAALKYAHGRIREDMNLRTYKAAIDTFSGNSGSPVYDERNHTLIGLLSGGEADFTSNPQFGCNLVKVCQSGNCLGERVFKTSSISALIKKIQLDEPPL